jgi:C-terminal processing protease CtpA/Prc
MDDRAQSQSEATAQMLRAVHGTIFVGSATTGANGEGSNFSVPGGIEIGITATGVSQLDGTQLQRIGVTPDIGVHPTIAGIRAGRDEVLDRAVQHLRSTAKQ